MAPRLKGRATATRGAVKGKRAVKEEPVERKGTGKSRPGRSRRVDKSKAKGKKHRYKLKLKGWLQTPADWNRFNAWAKINALPKKYPEPEPIVRESKPLCYLRKKLKFLALPRKAVDPEIHCRFDFTISRTALEVCPTRRTILLALPNVRLVDYGRVYYKISPAALKYQASERIIELSQPRALFLPEECRPPKVSRCAMKEFSMERLNQLALAKKLATCPQALTPEEIAILFTPRGVRRSALKYKATPWITFLALPPYKTIRHRKDTNAVAWKKRIIVEGDERGKSALAEEEEEKKKRGTKRKYEETEEAGGGGDAAAEDEEEDEETKAEKERKAKRRKVEKHRWRYAPHPCHDDPFNLKKGALTGKVPPRIEALAKARERKDRVTKYNGFRVKKSALSASASGRVESLAKPKRPRSPIEKKPPREKDEYGRPIFIIPVYEKVLPKTKPYKMGECPPKEEKEKKVAKKRPIDSIAYELTVDPCIYPDLAKKQKIERKRAEKLSPKEKRKRRRRQQRKRVKKETEKDENQVSGDAEDVPANEEVQEDKEQVSGDAEEASANEEAEKE